MSEGGSNIFPMLRNPCFFLSITGRPNGSSDDGSHHAVVFQACFGDRTFYRIMIQQYWRRVRMRRVDDNTHDSPERRKHLYAVCSRCDSMATIV